ncbi:glycosyltransferase family 4 protein [Desulfocurvibacter africanus]|uniref:glycosyltransferase family 4 protein n=1 Tax=Desulfocurvibacter africanus TaxID=873 RepID=UPI000407F7E3|nr:glycosyltransferase family 4 protein [Desulfocurvibacter africanus]
MSQDINCQAIAVCEPQCTGNSHEICNSGFLYVLSKAMPDRRIVFFANPEHIAAIKDCLALANLETNNIDYLPIRIPKTRVNPIEVVTNLIFFYRLLTNLKTRGINNLILLSVHSGNLLAIKILASLRFKTYKFSFLLHGIMEFASKRPSLYRCIRNPSIIWLHAFKYVLNFNKKLNMSYISLSPFNYNNFIKARILNVPLCTIHHPLIFKSRPRGHNNSQVNFAIIGQSHSGNFLKLVNELSESDNAACYNIFVLSNKLPIMRTAERFKFLANSKRLQRNEIDLYMKDVDILIFLYEKSAYNYSASGAFAEAIQYAKPILFLENDHLAYYNNLSNLSIGKSFTCIEDMANEIRSIATNMLIRKEWQQFAVNIATIRDSIDPVSNIKDFQKCLNI